MGLRTICAFNPVFDYTKFDLNGRTTKYRIEVSKRIWLLRIFDR